MFQSLFVKLFLYGPVCIVTDFTTKMNFMLMLWLLYFYSIRVLNLKLLWGKIRNEHNSTHEKIQTLV